MLIKNQLQGNYFYYFSYTNTQTYFIIFNRILGCLSRRDCKLLRSSYDANKTTFGGKSMSEMLVEVINQLMN